MENSIMSIRSLLSTTITATEDAIKGAVSLGSSIGDGTTWLRRQTNRLNDEEVIKTELREFRTALFERNQIAVARAENLDSDLPEKLEALDKLLGITK